jgi:hypothetical protein
LRMSIPLISRMIARSTRTRWSLIKIESCKLIMTSRRTVNLKPRGAIILYQPILFTCFHSQLYRKLLPYKNVSTNSISSWDLFTPRATRRHLSVDCR